MATCNEIRDHQQQNLLNGDSDYNADTLTAVDSFTLSGGETITGIRIRANAASTFNIDGGDTITLKKNEIWERNPPLGTMTDIVINVLTGEIHYDVEWLP